jgi:two-component system LytT family response regulator
MKRFHALVADDEPLARSMVAGLLRRDPDIEQVTECGDADGVRRVLIKNAVDMAFLDIEMPGESGLDLAERLGPGGPVVVFVTAFNRYATNAFDVQAIDYVMKPFSDGRFAEAVERAKRRVRERQIGKLANQLAELSAELKPIDVAQDVVHEHAWPRPDPATAARLCIKQGDRSIILDERDIQWVEAEDYYVLVHTTGGRHMIRTSLATMEERLSPDLFVRTHRGALVNLHEVQETRDGGSVVVLRDGTIVPVSRARRQYVRDCLEARFGLRS